MTSPQNRSEGAMAEAADAFCDIGLLVVVEKDPCELQSHERVTKTHKLHTNAMFSHWPVSFLVLHDQEVELSRLVW